MKELLFVTVAMFTFVLPFGIFLSRRNGSLEIGNWCWQDRWAFYLSAVIMGLWGRILVP